VKLSGHSLALLLLLLSAFIWGASTPVTKLILEEIPPLSLAFLRFLLATAIMATLTLWLNYHTPIRKSDVPRLALVGLLAPGLNISLGFVGLQMATALDSIIFASLTPIAIALAGVIFLKEVFTKVNLAGQILAFVGALVVLGSPTGDAPNRLVGDILLALSGLAWVAAVIISKEIFRKYHSFTITSFMFAIGTVVLAPLAAWEYLNNPTWLENVTASAWLGIVFLAVFTSVIAYLSFEWALERTTVSYSGIIEHFQLLVGAVLANLLLGEPLSTGFILGAGLVLIGIVFATRPAHHLRKAHRH
jgi:drug/metabolite transporter (DMT)-like permease